MKNVKLHDGSYHERLLFEAISEINYSQNNVKRQSI